MLYSRHMEEEQVRINKYLAEKGYSTRRGADELISAGKVTINGKKAVLGAKVKKGDVVEVRGNNTNEYVYLAYHKPKGVITHSPALNEKDIAASVKNIAVAKDTFPLGRLDKASSGLMLLTNDGRITDRLLNPEHAHEREYVVTVEKKLTNMFRRQMEEGVRIEGYTTKPTRVQLLDATSFSIALIEGKKHQIRRMCAALGYVVRDLKRVRIVNIELGTLTPNSVRKLSGAELKTFLSSLGL